MNRKPIRRKPHGPTPATLLLLCTVACSSPIRPSATVWTGSLDPLGGSGITGTVGAVSQGGRTSATVEIRKATAGETYGWRIDTGVCGGSGEIQGGAALYPDLTADEGGSASAEAGLSSVLKSGSPYAGKVFRVEGGEIVACTELVQTA